MQDIVDVVAAARHAKDDWGKATLREIRKALSPIRSDIRNSYQRLGGTGPLVAQTARTQVTARGAAVAEGSRDTAGFLFGREFGAKRTQTRPHTRRVQSGRLAARQVGGGETRVFVAHIDYTSPKIFGKWTGNQFELGQAGGRITLDKVSGNAFYPAVGKGAQNVLDALAKIADDTIARFPDGKAGMRASNAAASEAATLAKLAAAL